MLICLTPFVLAAFARYFQFFEVIELKVLDKRWTIADLQGIPTSPELALVTIDPKTEAALGPRVLWSPGDYQPLIATLQLADPAAIGLLIWLNREWPGDKSVLPGDSLLVTQPYRTDPSRWRGKTIPEVEWIPVIPNLQQAEIKSFSNFPLDPRDGVQRTVQLVVRVHGDTGYYQSLEFQALTKKWQCKPSDYRLYRSPWFGWQLRTELPDIPKTIPMDEQGRLWVRYTGGVDRFSVTSAINLLDLYQEGAEDLLRARFSGKIVLVGTHPDSERMLLTPRGRLSALELRANAIATLLNRDFVARWTPTMDILYLVLFAVASAGIALLAYHWHKGTLWIGTWHVMLLSLHTLWCVASFLLWRWWVDATGPALAITASAGVSALYLAYLRIGRLFSELRTTQRQLVKSEKEAAYGAMAAQVRHEVRNILNAIRSPAEMIRNNFERGDPLQLSQAPDQIVSEMNLIIERVVKLTEMIENELSFFQNTQYHFVSADLRSLIESSLDMAMDAIQACEAVVNVEITSEFPEVQVDRDKLRIAMLNLIRNACEAMPKQGRLSIEVELKGTHYEVHIRDTGRGIPKTDVEQVFEPFFTTKPRGLGLGLANVRNIVEGHHGNIQVTSNPGDGTCFSMRLPLRQHSPNPI